jgi:tetratricopeptide (TPR) repeat protein
VLAAPCVLVWPFIHPVGGIARDWDDFTFGAVALSMIAAWFVAEALGGGASPEEMRDREPAGPRARRAARRRPGFGAAAPAHGWLGVAVVAGVAVPAIQWIALHADFDRGLARVEAFARESPRRATAERARMLDYLGTITFQKQRWRESARAFETAVELAPSPRMLQQWALAETQSGDFHTAQRAYWRLVAKDSLNASAWLGLATVSSRFGDLHESRRAALRTLDLQPGQATAVALLRYLDALPQAMRDSLERLYPPRE